MDKIIDHFTPFFNDEIERKLDRVKENKNDLIKLKLKLQEVQSKSKTVEDKKKIEIVKTEILKKIEHLMTADVLYGSNKQVVRDILYSLTNMKYSQLKESLKVLSDIVSVKN